MILFGVDVGGTGIKGAPVDVAKGRLRQERHRIETPNPATPADVADVVVEVVRHFGWKGPIGCAVPSVVKNGVVLTAANVDESWLGIDGRKLLADRTRLPVVLLNDADAAGIAEMRFGAGKGRGGVVLMLTLGTGVGSALFNDGRLVPNTELGHLRIRGKDAEERASDRARDEKGWSWRKWAKRVNEMIDALDALFFPDLVIVGGGASKNAEKFLPLLKTRPPVVPAELRNDAGIVGAALAARDR